ncbi:hypothetical protein EYF80_026504 [Liparis tanakae]|uniref:Uncharacterized protein n=1 Tax=Liparis tanakae TaxID=230148 RepID=A0A4Z2HE16_9TELE|nr:hypothetical protein EYF80_026504 [Liparis tanakae]
MAAYPKASSIKKVKDLEGQDDSFRPSCYDSGWLYCDVTASCTRAGCSASGRSGIARRYTGRPSPPGAECFSKVYSTARPAGQRKDSILLLLLTHGRFVIEGLRSNEMNSPVESRHWWW